ncbi:hypothetical protein K523DRAFT_233474 [Schizophyllum commune Tattone D]|nr:hypothetical protein K523DRAFT_233474 [Schizophyllum commune Tattone D]
MSSTDPTISTMSWEGDHMFNVYVHDYCVKHGFFKTASELRREAGLSDAAPPIQTKQGFIFECVYLRSDRYRTLTRSFFQMVERFLGYFQCEDQRRFSS